MKKPFHTILVQKIIKFLVLVHRYLGLIFGLVILLWCLSGFVMMFVQYPDLTEEERYGYMAPLSLDDCCVVPDENEFSSIGLNAFVLEQWPSGPQLKLYSGGAAYSIRMTNGEYVDIVSAEERAAYANQIAQTAGAGTTRFVDQRDVGQWSIIPAVARSAPYDVFQIDDPQKSHLYLSQYSGELVQHVTFNERTWGWVGAVVHWIYPTVIRSNTSLWNQLVIWLSIISLFMVVVGAVLGFVRLRHKGKWQKSRFNGRYLWHHYTSLAAGILMLTWLFSGLMSMYPWGILEGRSFAQEVGNLRGSNFAFTPEVRTIIAGLDDLEVPEDTVELRGVQVANHLSIVATNSEGQSQLIQRFALRNALSDFPSAEQLAEIMRPGVEIASVNKLETGDSYYYDHHVSRSFPAHRIVYKDRERFYLDGHSMDLVAAFDDDGRASRWLFLGLHRGDIFPSLNAGLSWYIYWGGLLLVLTTAVAIGCWMAVCRWKHLLRSRK